MLKTKNQTKAFAFLKERFSELYLRYGYYEYLVPMFTSFDLYAKNRQNPRVLPAKFIAPAGDVLTISADATLNILQEMRLGERYKREKYFYSAQLTGIDAIHYTLQCKNQMGIENFSTKNAYADAEVIALLIASLQMILEEPVQVELSHADFVAGLLDEVRQIDAVRREKAISLIASKNTVALSQLLEESGVNEAMVERICSVCMLFGDFSQCFVQARALACNAKMHQALDEIQGIYDMLSLLGKSTYLRLDMGLVNPMNYYTGVMFHAYAKNSARAIGVGGRYDHISRKIARRAHACGFGLDMDMLSAMLQDKRERFKRMNKLTVGAGEVTPALLERCDALREKGYFVDLSIEDDQTFYIRTPGKTFDSFAAFDAYSKEAEL